jgi:hypothetical protein
MKSLILLILVFMSGLTHASQEFESILLKIQGEWHEQGQVCGTVLQFDYPDIVYIKTGQSEAHGKFKLKDGPMNSQGFDYSFDINISGNNGISACSSSIIYEVGDFPPMSFRLEENDTLNIEGSVFKRKK